MWKKLLLNAASPVMTHFSYGYSDADTSVNYCSFMPMNLLEYKCRTMKFCCIVTNCLNEPQITILQIQIDR